MITNLQVLFLAFMGSTFSLAAVALFCRWAIIKGLKKVTQTAHETGHCPVCHEMNKAFQMGHEHGPVPLNKLDVSIGPLCNPDCSVCHGTGWDPGAQAKPCPICFRL